MVWNKLFDEIYRLVFLGSASLSVLSSPGAKMPHCSLSRLSVTISLSRISAAVDLKTKDSNDWMALCWPPTTHTCIVSTTTLSAFSMFWNSFLIPIYQSLVNHRLHFRQPELSTIALVRLASVFHLAAIRCDQFFPALHLYEWYPPTVISAQDRLWFFLFALPRSNLRHYQASEFHPSGSARFLPIESSSWDLVFET